jgi:hypothetical protein
MEIGRSEGPSCRRLLVPPKHVDKTESSQWWTLVQVRIKSEIGTRDVRPVDSDMTRGVK